MADDYSPFIPPRRNMVQRTKASYSRPAAVSVLSREDGPRQPDADACLEMFFPSSSIPHLCLSLRMLTRKLYAPGRRLYTAVFFHRYGLTEFKESVSSVFVIDTKVVAK